LANANLFVGGILYTSAATCNTSNACTGIRFAKKVCSAGYSGQAVCNPGGGSGDAAWIRYWPASGEETVLELGVSNDTGAGGDHLWLNAAAGVYITTGNPTFSGSTIPCGNALQVAGNLGAVCGFFTGNVAAYYSSDAQFKENIQDIQNALGIVQTVGGKTYDWTDAYISAKGGACGYFTRKEDFGVIAQDVQKVFPVAVRVREDGSLALDYEKLVSVAFQAIKEQQVQIDDLKNQIQQILKKLGE
jgi:hypothetical protein